MAGRALVFLYAEVCRVLLRRLQIGRSNAWFPGRNKVDLVARAVISAILKAKAGRSQVQGQPGKLSSCLKINSKQKSNMSEVLNSTLGIAK